MKNLKYGLLVTLVFYSLVELTFVLVDWSFSPEIFRNYTINKVGVFNDFTGHIDPFYRNKFCDFIHQKAEGHRLIASCIADSFKRSQQHNSQRLIIAIGGSTTKGDDCESGTRWTIELEKILKTKVLNLGEGGENSDYSLRVLRERLEEGLRPSIVIDGDWLNEIFEPTDYQSKTTILLYKSYHTLYKHLRSFRFLSNTIHGFDKKRFTAFDMRNFMLHQDASMVEILGAKRFNFASGPHNSALFSEALVKYSKNMQLLHDLGKQYEFKVLSLNFPYVKNYYKYFSAKTNSFFDEKWIPQIKKRQKQDAIKYNFDFIDVETCFEEHRLNWREKL